MRKHVSRAFLVAVIGATMLGVPSAIAAKPTTEAVKSYPNCDALHKRWQYGVAKSRKAA